MRNSSKFIVLTFLLMIVMAAGAFADELAESFKMELETLYSAWQEGTELTPDQRDMLIQYGFISPEGARGSDRVSDPDAFGYTFIDNEEDNGPEYDWIDISGTGTVITGLADDNHVGPFDIGFSFPFYDQEHTQFYFQSNGTISFTNAYITLGNVAIPTTNHSDFIAWFWDDLDPGDGGTVYYETTEVNGQTALVISMIEYDDYPGGANAAEITAQVIMYESGKIIIQYDTIEEGMGVTSCTVGIQNSTGTIGLQYAYNGAPAGYPYDGLAIQFANSDATVDGTVTNSNSGAAIEGAEVYLYPDGETEPAYFATTDVNGEFHLEVLSATFDLEVMAIGYLPYTQADLVVEPDDALNLTIELDEPQNEYSFNGAVVSADTPDTPVVGVTVEVTNATGSASTVTDANGAYSFDLMDEGIYDIYITFDPAGSNGYHDLVVHNYLFDADGPHDFMLYEVLAPQNFSVTNGDGFAALSWDAPLNHQNLVALANTIELRRGYLNDLRTLHNQKSATMVPVIEAELYSLENEYNRLLALQEGEIDELGDFNGYFVMMNGEVLPNLYTGTSAQITGLTSGDFYDFQVAANYGYGEDDLVWSEEVTLEYFEVTYFYFPLEEYNWVEIDPATGVASTSLSLGDDGYTDGVAFPDGETFTFYGIEYSTFTISANGVISFTPGYITYGNSTLPNTGTPNNMICPFWEDLYPPATANGDPWYYYDEESNQMIVTWNNPPLGAQTNVLKFQVIMDLTDDYFIVNYDSAVSGWATGATIGVENTDGTRAVTWLDENGAPMVPTDQTGVIWTSGQGIFGVIEGTIDNAEGTALEDVVVELYRDGETEPFRTATTDENGYYRMSQTWYGLYDMRISQYPYEVTYVEDVEVVSDETTVVDVTMQLETSQVDLDGTILSADTPDLPVEGVSVYCEQLDVTVTTDANGYFTFGQQFLGVYSFELSFDPQGLTGYHNISYPLQEAAVGFDGYDFFMFEILPPQDFIAQVGDGFVACYWDLPVNLMTMTALEERISQLYDMVSHVESLPEDPEFIRERVEYLQQQLYPLENELSYRQMMIELGELDEIEDFVGYKLRVNGVILPDVIAPNATSFYYYDVTPDEEYTFELAADFGYLADQLVWSDPSIVNYYEINYLANQITNFLWEEIRPSEGGPGTAANTWTGGYTQLISFPEGQTFSYYGTEYSSASFSGNGSISFQYQWITWLPNGIPNTATPNNFMTAYWQEMSISTAADYDLFYYIDDVDNRVVVQWYAPTTWNGTNILNFQAVLDLEQDIIIFSYESATEAWLDDIIIGTENIDGTRGTVWPETIEDETTIIFAPLGSAVFGSIEGNITDSETSDPLEDVRVELYNSGSDEVVGAFFSAANGDYVIPDLWNNTYDLMFIAHGYHTQTIENVDVVAGEIFTQDIQLVPLGANPDDYIDLAGTLMSADTPDSPVEGASVYCYELDETVTTDVDGAFTFGEQFIGQYNFDIYFDPQGSTGYHNISYLLQDAPVGFGGFEYIMYEILPPEDFVVNTGDGYIYLGWSPPLNHVNLEVLTDRALELRTWIENLEEMQLDKNEAQISEFQLELFRVENEIQRRSMLTTDNLDDFVGYRIYIDGEVQDMLLPPDQLSINLWAADYGFENGVEYEFMVAAEYGYGDTPPDPDFLVPTAAGAVTYSQIDYFYWIIDEFMWIEIDPNNGGDGIPFGFGDDTSCPLTPFPNGQTFTYWGEPFSNYMVNSNGLMSFIDQYLPYGNTPLPSTNTPNGIICPFWEDLYPPADPTYDTYYLYNEDTNQMIFEWVTPPIFDQDNPHYFEVILDLNESFFVFSYLTTASGWAPDATIGLENMTGTRAVTVTEPIQDNMTIILGTSFPAQGGLEGYISYCNIEDYDPLAGAAVYIEGMGPNPIAFTDANGHFLADSVRVGERDIRIELNGFWPIIIDDFEFIEDEISNIDTLAMMDPNGTADPEDLQLNVFIQTEGSDSTGSAEFTLTSDGCGSLNWRARARMVETAASDYEPPAELQAKDGVLPGNRKMISQTGPVAGTDELDEPWSYLFGFAIDESDNMYSAVVGPGAVYVNELGSNPSLFQYDHNGSFVAEYPVPANMLSESGEGFYDMSSDPVNGLLVAGNDDGDLYAFNPEMTNVDDFGNIGFRVQAIAYDYLNNRIYASDGGTTFQMLDLSTYQTTDLPLPPTGMPITGLGYMPVDFDEAVLWILTQEEDGAYVYRLNPETQNYFGDAHQVYEAAWGNPGGMDISAGYNPGMLSVNTILQAGSGSDFLDIWEGLAAPVQWLWLEDENGSVVAEGWLEPNESETIVIQADIRYAEMQIQHGDFLNAEVVFTGPYWDNPPTVQLGIYFLNTLDTEEALPLEYTLHQNYPNPFNPMTEIRFDLVEPQNVKLSVYNVLGQEVTKLVNQRMEAGFHSVSFDATNMASGVYFYKIEAGSFNDLKKMVMIK